MAYSDRLFLRLLPLEKSYGLFLWPPLVVRLQKEGVRHCGIIEAFFWTPFGHRYTAWIPLGHRFVECFDIGCLVVSKRCPSGVEAVSKR